MVDRQEAHAGQSYSVDSSAPEVAAQVDRRYSIKSRRLASDLRIAGADAVKRVAFSADKNIAVGVYIQTSVYRRVRNTDRRLPCDSAVGGTLELHAAAAAVDAVVCLVLEAMPRAIGLIDCEPLLVAPTCAALTGKQRP
jgi:hypothetical protein